MHTFKATFTQRILPSIARFKWVIALAVLTCIALTIALAQSTTPTPSGGSLTLSAQVTASTGNTLNSTNSVGTNDEVQFTANITQPMASPSVQDGKMTFPSGFTWLAGKVLAPTAAQNLRWNTGTVASPIWVATEPTTGTSVSQFAWQLKPVVTLELVPTTQSAVNFSGTGDGFRVFTYKNSGATNSDHKKDHLYVINHHTNTKYLNCRDGVTGNACAEYGADGKTVSATNNTTLDNSGGANTTPNRSIEHLNPATGEVFFYVANDTGQIRVLCANLDTLKSCAEGVLLGTSAFGNKEGAVNPIGSIGNKYYAVSNDSKIYCYDTTLKAACSNAYPFAAKYSGQATQSTSMNIVMNSKLFYIANTKVACFDTAIDNNCAEAAWTGAETTTNKKGLYPVLNTDGTPKGVCVPTECRMLTGEVFTPMSHAPAYKAFLDVNQMFTANSAHRNNNGAYTQANYFGTKAFHTSSIDTVSGNSSIDLKNFATCFDFATNTVCPNFPINHATQQVRTYAITKDTVRNNCMWSIGDPAIARSFDPDTGGACTGVVGVPPEIILNIDPQKSVQCDGSATPIRGWKAVRFSPTLQWGAGRLSVLAVDITDAAGNPIASNPNRSFVSGAYTLDISDISYLTYPKLIFKLKPTVGETPIIATVGFDVTWDGDPVQVCAKVKAPTLATCSAVVAAVDVSAVLSHAPNATPDTLHADQSGNVGAQSNGVGPSANSTTLIQSPKGSSDPTQLLQTRFDMANYSGDLWQYELLSINTLSANPVTNGKASGLSATRNYYTSDGASGALSLKSLTWANLSLDQKALLDKNKAGKIETGTGKFGSDRIAYMTGTTSKEAATQNLASLPAGTFRKRPISTGAATGILAPAIDSSPAILQNNILAGFSNSQFPNYVTFKKEVARTSKLAFYSGNDNMLHAYKVAETGLTPAFSYMPSIALADVPRYTDSTLSEIVRNPYFMDNTPMVADVNLASTKSGNDWRSVVVANRGRGGRGVFALDVTGDKTKANAAQTKPDGVLFEYSNTTAIQSGEDRLADLGYNLGQPSSDKVTGSDQIVRVRSGTDGTDARWAYIAGNGINGSVGTDGKSCNLNNGPCSQKAVLYIFYLNGNLSTGASRWKRIPVNADAATSAELNASLDFGNGLSTPRPVDVDGDGVVDFVYAGDVKGNVWRFNLKDMAAVTVTKIFTTDGGQPIHTAPVVQRASGDGTCTTVIPKADKAIECLMVVFATGQDTNPLKPILPGAPAQKLYGILDKTNLTSDATVVTDKLTTQTIATSTIAGADSLVYRTVTNNAVDYLNGQRGWKISLLTNEHNTANPQVQSNGTVLFVSTRPITTAVASGTSSTCTEGWLTQVNAEKGQGILPILPNGDGPSVRLNPDPAGAGSYAVPSSLGGSTLNATTTALVSATRQITAIGKDLMIGRVTWREVFGAKKN